MQPMYTILGPHTAHDVYSICQQVMCLLTLTSFSWFTDFVKFMSIFHNRVSFSITIQPRFTIDDPHIIDGGFIYILKQMSPYLNFSFMVLRFTKMYVVF